ncbi:MAG: hypothetical protein OXJ62_11180, partial [Spirochaetaceae bacterium]|nr:hypothetical protein [Spirochaetaceae bacterium]
MPTTRAASSTRPARIAALSGAILRASASLDLDTVLGAAVGFFEPSRALALWTYGTFRLCSDDAAYISGQT